MRAAMMISRATLVNSAPRFASLAPFWRLIVDHLLWPDMARSIRERGPAPGAQGLRRAARPRVRAGEPPPGGYHVRNDRRDRPPPRPAPLRQLPYEDPGVTTTKSVDLPHLRSVVIAAHQGAGKTTLAERLLFE